MYNVFVPVAVYAPARRPLTQLVDSAPPTRTIQHVYYFKHIRLKSACPYRSTRIIHTVQYTKHIPYTTHHTHLYQCQHVSLEGLEQGLGSLEHLLQTVGKHLYTAYIYHTYHIHIAYIKYMCLYSIYYIWCWCRNNSSSSDTVRLQCIPFQSPLLPVQPPLPIWSRVSRLVSYRVILYWYLRRMCVLYIIYVPVHDCLHLVFGCIGSSL